MNLAEFSALEITDTITNAMTNGEGTVSAVYTPRSGRIVSVKWGPSGIEFSYTIHSTAWYHWSKVEKPPAAMVGPETGSGHLP